MSETTLLTEMRTLRQHNAALRDENTTLKQEKKEAVARADEYDQLFLVQYRRDMQACERWRAEDPIGRALALPDRGDLLDWLWGQLGKVEADHSTATLLLTEALNAYGADRRLLGWISTGLCSGWMERARALVDLRSNMTTPTGDNSPLKNVVRCQKPLGGGTCNSPIYYDWGIQVMSNLRGDTVLGGPETSKFADYAISNNVFICARCTTPYIKHEGEMVDISSELSAEDVKGILARGNTTLPQVKIKDP